MSSIKTCRTLSSNNNIYFHIYIYDIWNYLIANTYIWFVATKWRFFRKCLCDAFFNYIYIFLKETCIGRERRVHKKSKFHSILHIGYRNTNEYRVIIHFQSKSKVMSIINDKFSIFGKLRLIWYTLNIKNERMSVLVKWNCEGKEKRKKKGGFIHLSPTECYI